MPKRDINLDSHLFGDEPTEAGYGPRLGAPHVEDPYSSRFREVQSIPYFRVS